MKEILHLNYIEKDCIKIYIIKLKKESQKCDFFYFLELV